MNARRTIRARRTSMPYFVTVGARRRAVSPAIGTVTLAFADGRNAPRHARAGSYISTAPTPALPVDIRERITKRRRAGDEEAALDPLADPEVKAAIARTRFEMLVGFQLTDEQLRYNVTR